MLSAYKLRIVDIIMANYSFYLYLLGFLPSIFSYINTALLIFLWLVFAWYIYVHPYTSDPLSVGFR